MRKLTITGIIMLLMLTASCGGGDPFAPQTGPFTGQFYVDDEAIGTISLTVVDGMVAGTGVINHNASEIAISISGVVNGSQINAAISNQLLGHGDFDGNFSNGESCSGTFDFTDTLEISTSTGSWSAHM